MIDKIIAFSIRNKLIIGLLMLALIGTGIYSMLTINLGSVPDITNNQVQVITVSPNLATEDIEQFVTYPVELSMGNLPGVQEIRSVSRFGLSVVTIVFEDDMGTYLPRQLVQEKLSEVKKDIPEQFGAPTMGPITTGLGEIYQYTIEPKPGYDTAYTPRQLRTIQDWIVARQMTMVKGVVGVNAFGGSIKQYEIAIDPERLNAMNVTISEVFDALKRNNVNTGGAYIEKDHMANFIRGEGLVRSLDDIRNIVIRTENGIPILIKDVAKKVHFGNQVRYGAFTQDGHEAVGGMVLLLKGANPNRVIRHVKERMKTIQKSLPEGLQIKPFLDRSQLIERTTSTVFDNLLEGALIVVFVLVLLLGNIRGGLLTASLIPLSLLFAFILMKATGVWANLMSLGAIDFGIIVDGAVIIVEGTVHEVEKRLQKGQHQFSANDMNDVAYKAGSTMMNSAFFGQLIILIVFAPILFLTGVEGKMFRPMAFTFGFAVLGAIILCLTYVPMMSSLFMRPSAKKGWFSRLEESLSTLSNKLVSGMQSVYRPIIKGALQFRKTVIAVAILLLGLAVFAFSQMGGEFIPQLDEGDIAMQAMIRPGSGLSESINTSEKIETILKDNFPEIKTMVARIGVADIPTDPMPMDIADMFIILNKDESQWVSADSKEELIHKIKQKMKVLSGVNLVFSQPVELRFNELLTGVREDVAVKLYGEDLDVLSEKAGEMEKIIRSVPGTGDVNAERIAGLPQMTIRYDRAKIAQYGLDIQKLNNYVSSAFAGGKAGVIFEGEKRFDMVIRFDRAHRKSIDDLRNLYIDLPNGTQIPIKEVADINYRPGPMQISRENTFRRTFVGVNVRGRDVESVVKDIQKKLDEQLDLPPGYYITYGGAFENLQRAKQRLSIVVPIALFLIFLLLYFALKSLSQSVMIYMAVPLAAIGGVFLLAARGMPFSISAGVGFIVLFGVAVLNGLVLISRLNSLKQEGVTDITQRIFIAGQERLRPILLTALAAIMGFTPMAFSSSAGAEVQRPLATVVIGGLLSATILTLVVIPILYFMVETRQQKRKSHKSAGAGSMLLLIGLLAICWPHSSKAQDSLVAISLSQAQLKARQNYPRLKAASLEVENQEALKKTAWNFGNTQVFSGKDEVGNGSPGIYTKVGVKQQQIDLFGIAPKMRLQNREVELAQSALQLSTLEVKRELSKAWGDLYAARKRYQLYNHLDSVFSDIDRAAEIRLQTQETSRLEYLATKNQATKVQIQKEQAYRDYLGALQRFNTWFVSDTVFTVKDIKTTDLAQTVSLFPDTLENHPFLNYYSQEAEVADAQVKQSRAGFYPKLSGQYGLQQIGGQNGFYSFQVGISIPLFFGPELGKVQSAKIERQKSRFILEQARLDFKSSYREKQQQYLKWRHSWIYYRDEALPLAREQQEGSLKAYNQGAIDYITFLQNIRIAIETKAEAWDTYSNYLESRFELEYFTQNSK